MIGKSNWLLGLTLAAASLTQAQTKPATPPKSPEILADVYQIYSLLMPGQVFTDMDAGKAWAIADTTVNDDDLEPKLAPDATLQPPEDNPRGFAEALSDYQQRRKERMVLTRRFTLSRSYVLLKASSTADFKASKTSLNADSDAQSTYADYLGITYFSEVYFSTAQNAALVYILDWCGNLCSQSEWVYVEKQNGAWVKRSGKAPPQS
jgi:hypothetical protein